MGEYRILRSQGAAVPNAIAAILSYTADFKNQVQLANPSPSFPLPKLREGCPLKVRVYLISMQSAVYLNTTWYEPQRQERTQRVLGELGNIVIICRDVNNHISIISPILPDYQILPVDHLAIIPSFLHRSI